MRPGAGRGKIPARLEPLSSESKKPEWNRGNFSPPSVQKSTDGGFFRSPALRVSTRGVIMFSKLKAEIDSIMERDPAARSRWEVFSLYSGFKAVRSYRKAHWLLEHGHPFLARWVSQRSRHKTGIEIHPGAKIGKGLFIDHGMGVVIGETAEIGDYCTLYQGVTLGGTGKDKGKRHPTLGDHVLVGSGAKILGPMKIGNNARIAAGAVVLNEVPDNATAVGVPARVVRINGVRPDNLDQVHVSDPVSQELCRINNMLKGMEKTIDKKRTADDKPDEKSADQKHQNFA